MGQLRKRIAWLVLVAIFLAGVFSVSVVSAKEVAGQDVKRVKNVIVLITDGTSTDHVTIARWYQGAPLFVEDLVVAAERTYSADSLISDSAPAASAFATGRKTDDKFISVSPALVELPSPKALAEEEKFVPLATVLEAAKLNGKATGLVATSNIQHATPAAFSSHTPSRNDNNDIAEQQVYQDIDVVLGGGKQYLLPKDQGGTREDGANLVETLKQMGYGFVEDTAGMKAFSGTRLWGAFAPDAMAYDFDRDQAKEPSLAEMTQKAIDILSKNPKGFFLFVEASKTDWASHSNDPVGVISEVLAWDKAVKAAVDFAKRDKNTLVLAFADHGNGGMTLGLRGKPYSNLKMAQSIDILKKARLTGEGVAKKLNADRSNIKEVMAEYYGIADLTDEEIDKIKNAKNVQETVGPMLSSRSVIGWTTEGHTGEDLFVYAYGRQTPRGTLENTELGQWMAAALGVDLDGANSQLYRKADESLFGGAKVTIDTVTDPKNPAIVVEKGAIKAIFPANTNQMIVDGQITLLRGLNLVIKGRGWVSADAVKKFAAMAR